jgi:hypothetical protein
MVTAPKTPSEIWIQISATSWPKNPPSNIAPPILQQHPHPHQFRRLNLYTKLYPQLLRLHLMILQVQKSRRRVCSRMADTQICGKHTNRNMTWRSKASRTRRKSTMFWKVTNTGKPKLGELRWKTALWSNGRSTTASETGAGRVD